MKKIFLSGIIVASLAPTAFATHYDFYAPLSASHENFQSPVTPRIATSWPSSNPPAENAGRFVSKDFYCINPEKNGEAIPGTMMISHPFARLIPQTINTTNISFIPMKVFTKSLLNNTEKNIIQTRTFGFEKDKNTININCQLQNEIFNAKSLSYDTKKFFEQIQTGDTLTFHIQPKIGTTFTARYLSPFAPNATVKVVSNLSTDPNIRNLEILPEFLCFKKYGCEVAKAIITTLSGEKKDITKNIFIDKNGAEITDYSIVDSGFIVPKDTKSITFEYRKL